MSNDGPITLSDLRASSAIVSTKVERFSTLTAVRVYHGQERKRRGD